MIFIDQNYLKMTYVIFDRFSSTKRLSITKNLVNAKLLVVGKLLVDTNLFFVGKHLVDTKHLALIKMLTDLTYLPDLKINEKLEIMIYFLFPNKANVFFFSKKNCTAKLIVVHN